MTPYLILLFVITFIAYMGRRYGSNETQKVSIFFIGLLLVLFAGLRNKSVGTDTGTYISLFFRFGDFEHFFLTPEVGFNALRILTKLISDNYAVHLIGIALLVVSLYLLTITKLTRRYETSIFLFVTLGFYTFFFNGARQGIAAAICFFAIPWLLERKPKQYFSLIALAFLFHKTSFVAIFLYFVAMPRVKLKQILIIIFAALTISLFLSQFVQLTAVLFGDKYASYSETTEGGGRITTLFLVVQGLALYVLRTRKKELLYTYNMLLSIYFFGLVPVIAGTISNVNPSGILRLHLYFSSTAILLWPMVFSSWKNSIGRMLLGYIFIIFTVIYFFLTTSSFSHLVPYKFNWDIFL